MVSQLILNVSINIRNYVKRKHDKIREISPTEKLILGPMVKGRSQSKIVVIFFTKFISINYKIFCQNIHVKNSLRLIYVFCTWNCFSNNMIYKTRKSTNNQSTHFVFNWRINASISLKNNLYKLFFDFFMNLTLTNFRNLAYLKDLEQ